MAGFVLGVKMVQRMVVCSDVGASNGVLAAIYVNGDCSRGWQIGGI